MIQNIYDSKYTSSELYYQFISTTMLSPSLDCVASLTVKGEALAK